MRYTNCDRCGLHTSVRSSEKYDICPNCFEKLIIEGVGTDIQTFMNTPCQDNIEATRAYFSTIFTQSED